MNDKEIATYCEDWVRWCETRGFYLQPGAKNILARMQPSKSGREPNARNDPDMQFFNMAIHTIADMKEHYDGMVCFNLLYCTQKESVKRKAHELGICTKTYYNRAGSFARKAYSMSLSLKAAHAAMREQSVEMVD